MKRVLFIGALLYIIVQSGCTGFNSETVIEKTEQEIPLAIRNQFYSDSSNPITDAKVELGRYLFYDKRLSVNKTKSCASCHDPRFSFTDTYRRSVGAYGDLTAFNSPPLINLAFNRYFTYTDTSFHTPEKQINNPMFADAPVELGWKSNEEKLLKQFENDAFYQTLFAKAFPGLSNEKLFTVKHVQYSITSFIKTIVSFHSPYDEFTYNGNKAALNKSALRGMVLFNSAELKCNQCHGGINFNEPSFKPAPYVNSGFFPDTILHRGLAAKTGNAADVGKYKIPTLRNLAFTSPYLHDGSVESLQEVIGLFEKGNLSTDKNKHPYITGFTLNLQQRNDLIQFLLCLSDSSVIKKSYYQDPWGIK